MLLCLLSCQDESVIVARVNGENIYMSEIEDDIAFVTQVQNIDTSNETAMRNVTLSVLQAHLVDYMCIKELERLGLTYNRDYYGASYELLVETFGGESNLLAYIRQVGLNHAYIEEVCKEQARKATLSEYLVETYKKGLSFSDEDLMTYYIVNNEEFSAEEVRNIYHLTFTDKTAALEALTTINQGSFMEYYKAQETNQTCDFYGGINNCEKAMFDDSVGNIIFSLNEGTHHDGLLQTFQGTCYSIIYVDKITKNYKFTFEEMKEAIKEFLIEEAVDKYLEDYFTQLNEVYKVEILY